MDSGLKVPELLAKLRARAARPIIAIIAAHPDDEIIGAGAQLPGWPSAVFIQVTDGAPRDLADARAAGFGDGIAYAAARQMEFRQALLTARLGNKAVHQLGLADQESSLAMADLAHLLTAILDQLRPEIVLTHPYEGGHPDHDATAFGVHAASALLQQFHNWKPILLEMTSYHNRSGRMESGEFIPRADAPATTFVLTESEIQFKRRLFECFATQRRVLAGFRIEYERFRAAPVYDFLEPPHDGILYYEMFNWGMTGARWRTLAEQALMKLGLAKPVPVGLGGGGEYVNCS